MNIVEKLSPLVASEELTLLSRILGPEVYLVGGAVRDVLLGRNVGDLDIATNHLPAEILRRLEEYSIRVIPTGLKHQTVTALVPPSGNHVEITTFRDANMDPRGGIVKGDSIKTDLSYRDFTINSFAVSLKSGEFLDPHRGLDDLREKRIRAVGNPTERFTEDPLRMMRAIRLACELGFLIEPNTIGAICKLAPTLKSVSIERVREEFSRLLVTDNTRDGLTLLLETHLLEIFLPEIMASVGCEQNEWHSRDVFNHTLDVIEKTAPDLATRLGALFHDIGKPASLSTDPESGTRHFFKHESIGAEMTREIMERLRYSTEMTNAVVTLVQTHMRPLEAGTGGLRRILRDTGEYYEKWRDLKQADAGATNVEKRVLEAQFQRFDEQIAEIVKGPELSPLSSLAVKGGDILAAGIAEGPLVGKILRALHERVLDNPELNTKEQLLELVSKMDLKAL